MSADLSKSLVHIQERFRSVSVTYTAATTAGTQAISATGVLAGEVILGVGYTDQASRDVINGTNSVANRRIFTCPVAATTTANPSITVTTTNTVPAIVTSTLAFHVYSPSGNLVP